MNKPVVNIRIFYIILSKILYIEIEKNYHLCLIGLQVRTETKIQSGPAAKHAAGPMMRYKAA